MEEGYYIPDKTEFHLGFEFESNWNNEGWKADKISNFKMMENFDWIFKPDSSNKFRVKYLDVQDIESLGWSMGILYKNRYSITLVTINRTIGIIDSVLRQACFIGKIKNKGELQKLMKQLEI